MSWPAAAVPPRSEGEVLAKALADAPLLLLVCDGEGRILVATGVHLERALGDPGPFVGRFVRDLPAAATVVKDLIARAVHGERGVGRLALPDEVLQLQVIPSVAPEGVVANVVAIGLREVQQASSDEAFMRLFQASPIPISLSSLEGGVFSHCNDAFVRTFGYPRDEVVGRGSVELGMWSPEQRARAIAELREKGVLIGHESGVRTKHGDVRDIIFNMERIEFAGRTHLVGFFYDITERTRAEAELRRLYEQLRELDELKGQLIANVSHELRTPLTLILGLVERLMQGAGTHASRSADLALVHRNARSLLKQVNDLLEVARFDAGQVTPRYVAVDLAETVRLVASPFEVIAAERGMTLALEVPDRLQAEVDVDKFERILVNLLSNAFKYTPPGGRVRCTLQADEARVVLRVADSGPGIAPEHRGRVFERFFQVEGSATRRHGGTGLGLAIVRELADVMKGSARAEEAPEGGALIRIELGRYAPHGARVERPAGSSGSSGAAWQGADESLHADLAASELAPTHPVESFSPGSGDSGASVLVVEDHPDMRRFIADSLRASYRVSAAADGREGLAKALELRPDLVITDVMMPELSGDELVRAIRARAELTGMRVLLLTAKADDALRVRMLREGADDFVTKPFSVDELLARVASQIAIKQREDALDLELRDKADKAKRLADELRQSQKMEAIGRLAGGVAHDFNNLLTVIGGYASLLAEGQPPGDPNAELAGEIKQAADRAAELTRQLLAFSRRQMLQLQVLDLNEVVRRLERMFKRVIGEDIAITTELAPALGPVRADAGQLEQVLLNLVFNARDAMPEGGRLVIETGEVVLGEDYASTSPDVTPGTWIMLAVSDTGSGMSAEVRQRIFEPFFTTKELGKGTGLGLATAYGIVRQTDGHIACHSAPGSGTVFRVYLARAADDDRTPPLPAPDDAEGAGHERVLLVEDDVMVRGFAQRALEGLGYEVLAATDGEDALTLCAARTQPVDVVVTDIVMPRMGGRELTRRLLERWPDARVVYVSGYTDDAILRRGVLEEGTHFVQKPFTAMALGRAVRRALA